MADVVFLLPTVTPAELAAAVRVELAPELARINVAVSSRATPADVTTSVVVGAPVVPVVEVQ
jgi:hypothetical protein